METNALDNLPGMVTFELLADADHSLRMVKTALGEDYAPSANMMTCCGGNAGATTACINIVKYTDQVTATRIFDGLVDYKSLLDSLGINPDLQLPLVIYSIFKRHRAVASTSQEIADLLSKDLLLMVDTSERISGKR